MKTVMVAGATGLVGSHALRQALAHAQVARVVAPTRRALPTHPKLVNPVVDFERLPEQTPADQRDQRDADAGPDGVDDADRNDAQRRDDELLRLDV